ncbi:MAG TPA: hypothetical protein VNT79_06045, partial [Phycisphaerae bacterium]|nr:hypothetical protein [Phycisphaerae bacterium]
DFFVRTQKESIDLVRTLSEAELESPAGEEAHPLFATKAQAVGTAVMHETFHAGQIAMIRRELGRKALR